MDWRQVYRKIERPLEFIAKWVGYISALTLAIGFISRFFAWGNSGPFLYLKSNLQTIWLVAATLFIITLWIWVSRLNYRFASRFTDNFSGDLQANWDYEGPWRIAEKNTLLVTGSDAGGLAKVGATWENYTFTFDARITNTCLGVIVRAQDLNNYYMFQINTDAISPHRRVAIPLIEDEPKQAEQEQSPDAVPQPRFVKFRIGWQIFQPPTPITPPLDKWFKARIVVRGESISVYIDDELRYQQDSFLKIPMGKVGFRNYGAESALVRNVQVIVQP